MTDELAPPSLSSFNHSASFEAGEVSGNLRMGKLEGYYEELFAEVIEDGVITTEERARLDRMADSLGLDRSRLRRLEEALQAAYEARHKVAVREPGAEPPPSVAMPKSIMPIAPASMS